MTYRFVKTLYTLMLAILCCIVFSSDYGFTPVISDSNFSQKISASDKFIKDKLNSMNLREKIAQMIISSTIPDNFDENSSEFVRMKNLCQNTRIGGFIFFKGQISDYSRLSNKLQAFSETPLLISSDFERGTGMRVTDGTLFPNNMAIGAADNTELAYKMGLQIATESRLLGVQQDYAPVCDVNNNPNNPIINVRSFGEDPQLVSRMSGAMIKGLQDGKVIATAKHFPGHGDTEIDSHKDLPILNFGMDRLNDIELVPFKNAISNNVMSVMVAHLSFPELETKEHIPSSLSENIVNGLLINQLGFKGLVVTDALNMKGITKYFSVSQVGVMCVTAGIDLILMPMDEETTIDAIETAVKKGIISEERINQSAEKILKAKEWLGLFENKTVSETDAYQNIRNPDADKLGQQIADESITLVKDDNNSVPIKNKKDNVLLINLSDGSDNNSSVLTNELTGKFSNFKSINLFSDLQDSDQEAIISKANDYDHIIAAIFVKVKIGTGKISVLPSQVNLLNELSKLGSKLIVISFGNPYILKEFPSVPNYICAYGEADVSIHSSIKCALGEIKFKGRLPVTINDSYKFGTGLLK